MRVLLACLVVGCLVAAWPGVALAQAAPGGTAADFQNKNYAEYLAKVNTELADVAQRPHSSLDKIVMVAIALEKTQGWAGDSGKAVQAALKDSPDALRYLEVTQQLLTGETKGLARFFDGKEPSGSGFITGKRILKEHGFELAANCLCVISGDMPGLRAVAWVNIPAEKRGPVDALMDARYPPPYPTRYDIAHTAMGLYLRPPKDLAVDPKELLALARRLGGDTMEIDSLWNAEVLQSSQRHAEAAEMALRVAAKSPTDAQTQCIAAMICGSGLSTKAYPVFQQALKTVPSPEVREVRLWYIHYVRQQANARTPIPGAIDPATFVTQGDLLFTADAWLMDKQFDLAAEAYRKVMANAKEPLPRRLEAWTGLLASQPANALDTPARKLLTAISTQFTTPDERDRYHIWCAQQLWRSVARAISYGLPAYPSAPIPPCRPLSTAPNWQQACAELLDVVLVPSYLPALREDTSRREYTLRLPAAFIYALANRPAQAVKVLNDRCEYLVPPPPGGWPMGPAKDANLPRKRVTPASDTTPLKLLQELLFRLCVNSEARTLVPPLCLYTAQDVQARFPMKSDEAYVKTEMRILALTLYRLCPIVEPTKKAVPPGTPEPPLPPVDISLFTPTAKIVVDILQQDAAAKAVPTLLHADNDYSLFKCLFSAHDPAFQKVIFDLITTALDRYAQVEKPAKVAQAVEYLVFAIGHSKRDDLQPYAQQLKEKYLQAK